MKLEDRIAGAIERIKDGCGNMRIPPDPTDPDIVLFDCSQRIAVLEATATAKIAECVRTDQRVIELNAQLTAKTEECAAEHERAESNYASLDRIRDKYSTCANDLKAAQATIAEKDRRIAELEKLNSDLSCNLLERIAQIRAHRAVGGNEHDPEHSMFHGMCIVCIRDWPCEYAGTPPTKAERLASSACPICGIDEPHNHSRDDIRNWLQAQASRFGVEFVIDDRTSAERLAFEKWVVALTNKPTEWGWYDRYLTEVATLRAACEEALRLCDGEDWLSDLREQLKAAIGEGAA